MSHKQFSYLVIVGGIIGILTQFISFLLPDLWSTYLTFPTYTIGLALRSLSLGSVLGNGLALFLYVLISLSPLLCRFICRRKQSFRGEDYILIGLSAFLFWGLYQIINRTSIYSDFTGMTPNPTDMAINITALSIVLSYFVFRIIRTVNENSIPGLFQMLQLFLAVLAGVSAYYVLGPLLQNTLMNLNQFGARDGFYVSDPAFAHLFNNVDAQAQSTQMFTVVQFLIQAIAQGFTIYIAWLGTLLLEEIQTDLYAESVGPILSRLALMAKRALIFTVVSETLLNLALLLASQGLYAYNFRLSLPFTTITLVIVTLILTHYLQQMRQLKLDSEMII